MSDLPTHFRAAQLFGTLGASWLSGNMAALSLISVPALMRSHSEDHIAPVDVARCFKRTLERGGINPLLIALVACTNGYLAWSYRPGSWCLRTFADVDMVPYLAAAALTFSIVPFTMIAIMPINRAMGQKAEGVREGSASSGKSIVRDDTQELLGSWVVRNGVRSLLALAAATLTTWVVL